MCGAQRLRFLSLQSCAGGLDLAAWAKGGRRGTYAVKKYTPVSAGGITRQSMARGGGLRPTPPSIWLSTQLDCEGAARHQRRSMGGLNRECASSVLGLHLRPHETYARPDQGETSMPMALRTLVRLNCIRLRRLVRCCEGWRGGRRLVEQVEAHVLLLLLGLGLLGRRSANAAAAAAGRRGSRRRATAT